MNKKLSREELVEARKRALARKEMEKNLIGDLSAAEKGNEQQLRFNATKNPYIIAAINFFGTIAIIEAVVLLFTLIISPSQMVMNVIHVSTLIVASLSVLRKRSLLDDLINLL